jgi:hypothetical protein
VSLLKRVQKIETSLPPVEAVLLWLKEMLELGQERYSCEMMADPRNPRVVIAQMIGDAIRENVNHAVKPEVLEQAVREAQKIGDMRMVLVLNVHEYVRGKTIFPHSDLLDERFARILSQTSLVGLNPKAWELWQAQLTNSLIEKWCLVKIIELISVEYYYGNALLFKADEELLKSQIASLEDLMEDYNSLEGRLPGCTPIIRESLSDVITEHAERQVKQLVVLARAKTLATFGEEEAARELLASTADTALRELNLRRSSSQSQKGGTC